MSDDFTFDPFDGKKRPEVTIRVKRRKQPGEPEAAPAPEAADDGIMTGFSSPDELALLAQKYIYVYDLGTRLRTVAGTTFDGRRFRASDATDVPSLDAALFAEYVDIDLALHPGRYRTAQATLDERYYPPTDEEFLSLNARFLGQGTDDPLDPFGFTVHGETGKRLAHCQPIPLWSESEVNAGREYVHLVTIDGSVFDRKGYKIDEARKWNTLNVAATSLKAARYKFTGRLNHFRIPQTGYVPSDDAYNATMYEVWDTADLAQFKITGLPNFGADEIEFRPNGAPKVYLVPAMYAHVNSPGGLGPIEKWDYYWTDRMPLYPYPVWPDAERSDKTRFTMQCVAARHSDISGMTAYADEGRPGAELLSYRKYHEIPLALPAGALVGVIVAGRKYYIWRRIADAVHYVTYFIHSASLDIPYTGDYIHF